MRTFFLIPLFFVACAKDQPKIPQRDLEILSCQAVQLLCKEPAPVEPKLKLERDDLCRTAKRVCDFVLED